MHIRTGNKIYIYEMKDHIKMGMKYDLLTDRKKTIDCSEVNMMYCDTGMVMY